MKRKLIIFLGIIAIILIFNYLIKNTSAKYPLLDPSSFSNLQSSFAGNKDSIKKNSLEDIVQTVLDGSQGDYAVVIKNLKTGESYFRNENKSYETGSLYKLWVMAAVFKQIQEGNLTEDEVLSDDVASLNQEFGISPEDAELTSGTITMTVGDALRQMITISHNYAAMLLTDKIKISSVENFLKQNGFTKSGLGEDTDTPFSTASDISLFLEKLYKGELANLTYTAEMLDILKGQQFNQGISKYLSEQTVVANKTGDIGWFKHDAGIVFTAKGDYVIVVMSESEDPLGAQERIALISKAVYEYFNR